MTTKARALMWGLALASALSLTQCDSDGVTPVCPAGGGDCVTPPGTSTASVTDGGSTNGTGGTTGSGGSGGSAGTNSTAGDGGSAGTPADGGLTTLLDAALDLGLGH
jgi:hypothetical protein